VPKAGTSLTLQHRLDEIATRPPAAVRSKIVENTPRSLQLRRALPSCEDDAKPLTMFEPSLANHTLGRYQLLVPVARGGMGQVWLGRLKGARGFNKVVAVKTLLPNEADRPRLEAMLAEEARLSSLIQHPNVVHTIDLGEHEGLLYLVMEWVDGEPLSFLRTRADERGGMPISIAVQLVSQLLSGLHAAHELADETGPLGVVHRDVSPHNILVTYDGVAKLLDFGIAKATHQSTSSTEAGEIKGKFSYMAPEQILSGDVDRRCDVFAAGIVLYNLTTGQHPFKNDTTASLIHEVAAGGPATPPSKHVADFPPALEQVLMKALEKNVARRWASAEEMRVALERAVPEGFGDAGRDALREFMERTVGDRKVARREAVRRATLAANSRDTESKPTLPAPADSGTSLRAITISQRDSAGVPEVIAPSPEPTPPLTPVPPPKRRFPLPWLAAAGGLLVAVASLLPRAMPGQASSHVASAVAPAAGAVLMVPSPATSGPVAEPPAPPALTAAEPAPAPPAVSASTPARLTSANPGAAAPKPAKAAAPKRAKKADVAGGDLLAPDYAR
jgi:serine/threonine protein kinase